jgi:hypothetical protein
MFPFRESALCLKVTGSLDQVQSNATLENDPVQVQIGFRLNAADMSLDSVTYLLSSYRLEV